jgi:heat shock protein HslJ
MKTILPVLFASILFMTVSCGKEDPPELQGTEWHAVKIKKNSSFSFKKLDKKYEVVFDSDTTFTAVLDANRIWGHYRITGEGRISFDSTYATTYVCCESVQSDEFMRILLSTDEFYGKAGMLIFEGKNGKVMMEK